MAFWRDEPVDAFARSRGPKRAPWGEASPQGPPPFAADEAARPWHSPPPLGAGGMHRYASITGKAAFERGQILNYTTCVITSVTCKHSIVAYAGGLGQSGLSLKACSLVGTKDQPSSKTEWRISPLHCKVAGTVLVLDD